MKKIEWTPLLIWIAATELVGLGGSLLAGNMYAQYASLVKPALSPPGWLFGIIWPILYALLGGAAYIVAGSSRKSMDKTKLLLLFGLQLLFNVLWVVVFFRFDWYWGAFGVILILDLLAFFVMLAFFAVDKKAGYLVLPYFIWLLFATYLNLGFAFLN